MQNKTISILVFFLILFIGSAIVLIWKKSPDLSLEIYQFVPTDAGIIIETNNPHKLSEQLKKNNSWQEIIHLESCKNLKKTISYIDSNFHENKNFYDLLHKQQMIISLHPEGFENFSTLFSVSFNSHINEKTILEEIKKHVSNYTEKTYENTSIYSFESPEGRYNFSILPGVVLLSHSSILIEKSIRQSQTNHNLLEEPGFKTIRQTAGSNADANIFISPEQVSKSFSGITTGYIKNLLGNYSEFSGWTALDMTIKEDFTLFNGFSGTNENFDSYLSVLKGHTPKNIHSVNAIPASIHLCLVIAFNSFEQYLSDYKNFLSSSNKINSYKDFISEYDEKYNGNIEGELSSFINREAAYIRTNMRGLSDNENKFILIETKTRSLAEETLNKYTKKHAELKGQKLSRYQSFFYIDKQTSYPISVFPEPTLFTNIFGSGFFLHEKDVYYTFIDNYILFGISEKALSAYIHNYILRRSLLTNYGYKDISDYSIRQVNLMLYINHQSLPNEYNKFLEKTLSRKLKNETGLSNIRGLLLEISADNNLLYNNFVIHHSQEKHTTAKTEWECLLDAPVNIKPALVINHNTNEREIFVQDENHAIYLINKAGRILWKIQLDNPILSDVYQIDYYKNNKLQLLFNTKDKIYLIDRNGNPVERYPVQLRSLATSPISVFDYENNKNYRFFIAGDDRSIYCYDQEGNIIKGWEFTKSETNVVQPVKHFRIGTRDYLFIADQYNVYILNRRGEKRVIPKESVNLAKNSEVFLSDENNPKFVFTDQNGHIISINLEGNVEKKQAKNKLTPEHYFMYEDINGNGNGDYIFFDKNNIHVYNHNNELIFQTSVSSNISSPPISFHFSTNDRKLGAVCKEEGLIFLFNNDGSLYRGFPLKGHTPFSITRFKSEDKNFNLLVGGKGNFLYNYILQ